uniref:Uncharacterized protein n=1 Tax=Opuntia streptacantha TaxID=393608 RepID=A0A7C8Z8S4_OPUST
MLDLRSDNCVLNGPTSCFSNPCTENRRTPASKAARRRRRTHPQREETTQQNTYGLAADAVGDGGSRRRPQVDGGSRRRPQVAAAAAAVRVRVLVCGGKMEVEYLVAGGISLDLCRAILQL